MTDTREYARPLSAVSLAWFLSLGVDLFLHGGLLARFYFASNPFVLPAADAFRRIPFGYAALLAVTAGLYWLYRRLNVRGIASGAKYGCVIGFVVWGAMVLGLYSISTAPMPLLAAWWLGQSVELAFAGGVIGGLAAGIPARRMLLWVTAAVVTCFVITIVLQNIGLAPSMRLDK